MDRVMAFRLPVTGHPRAVVTSDYGLCRARVCVGGRTAIEVCSPAELARGASAALEGCGLLALRAADGELELTLDGALAVREEDLAAPVSRSAWIHAWIALTGSLLGFIASGLYLQRARIRADPWAMKMALHMAGWHLLLTLTLFPASVLGQRTGIRAVQTVSALFFAIHVGLALCNTTPVPGEGGLPWIASLNAASGLAFLIAALYGRVAFRDMDPEASLSGPGHRRFLKIRPRAGRARPRSPRASSPEHTARSLPPRGSGRWWLPPRRSPPAGSRTRSLRAETACHTW